MTASFIVRDMSWLSSESKRVGHRSLKQNIEITRKLAPRATT